MPSLGARLPDDYAWFLAEYGGGDFAFARVFSADPGSHLYIASNQGAELPPGVVSFAENGAGDSYVFPVEDGLAHDRVLVYDHETAELGPYEGGFLTFLHRTALR